MDWPEQRREGFALAAAARGDRGASQAVAGLCADVAAAVTSVAARIAASDAAARRSWVREVLRRRESTFAASDGVVHQGPARALALLAPSVDRELGRRWLRDAPLPRPGYVPDPRLLALLRQLVARAAQAPVGGAWRA